MNRQFVRQVLRLTSRLRNMSTEPPKNGDLIHIKSPSPSSATSSSTVSSKTATAKTLPTKAAETKEEGTTKVSMGENREGDDGDDDKPDMFARRRLHPNQGNLKLNSQRGIEQFLDIGTSAGARRVGRAWRTSELRLKSFDDLHKLWFILLKERNILLTERAWCKTNGRHWTNGSSNMYKVKTSMGRVKCVVGERIRAIKVRRVAQTVKEEAEGISADGEGLKDIGAIPRDANQRIRRRWPEVSESGTPFRI